MIIFIWFCLGLCIWHIICNLIVEDFNRVLIFGLMAIPMILAIKLDLHENKNNTQVECKEKGGIYIKIDNQYKCASKIEFMINEERE